MKRRVNKKRYNRHAKAHEKLKRIIDRHGMASPVSRAQAARAQKAFLAYLKTSS